MTARHPGLPLWYCGQLKCKRVPCQGHEPTHDQIVWAQAIAWTDHENWSAMTPGSHRQRLWEAWQAMREQWVD